MWFKKLLSYIFKKDFTAFVPDPSIEAEARKQWDALPDDQKAQYWTGNCNAYEIWYMSTFFPQAIHYCCDGAMSSAWCNQTGIACSGHGGPCCSRC